ncbi:hypothetical protein PoB_002119400 [Plakobranchus ocellatus]|uniref:Uncharacterized protein n=1 Tax=Plakobranchus ocellatus TaxID=259542 RepID=A0AAV3ZLD8_9GAST|nr:hypothetical protein PoB_002119400 [Plakobranchus ocellatus]
MTLALNHNASHGAPPVNPLGRQSAGLSTLKEPPSPLIGGNSAPFRSARRRTQRRKKANELKKNTFDDERPKTSLKIMHWNCEEISRKK